MTEGKKPPTETDEEWYARHLAEAPPLTEQQIANLRRLLRPRSRPTPEPESQQPPEGERRS